MATKKRQGPFPTPDEEGADQTTEPGQEHEGSEGDQPPPPKTPTPDEVKKKQAAKLTVSVAKELKWRKEAMEHMDQGTAAVYYGDNVKRLEDELVQLNAENPGVVEAAAKAEKEKEKEAADAKEKQAEQDKKDVEQKAQDDKKRAAEIAQEEAKQKAKEDAELGLTTEETPAPTGQYPPTTPPSGTGQEPAYR